MSIEKDNDVPYQICQMLMILRLSASRTGDAGRQHKFNQAKELIGSGPHLLRL